MMTRFQPQYIPRYLYRAAKSRNFSHQSECRVFFWS